MKRQQDIEAQIHFIPTEQGGRKGPAFDNFRQQFYYNGRDWDTRQEYPDVEQVNPGDTVRACLSFLNPQCLVGKIYPGLKFQVREGQRVVGQGEVTKILELEVSAQRMLEKNPDCMENC